MFVDQTRLWLSRGAEGDHALSYVELAAVDAFVTVDEGSYAFAVRSVTGTSTVFKAKSRAEMKEWRVAIEQRSDAVSENNLIAMADDHIAQNELDRVEDNMLTLRSLSEFRGTLCNRCVYCAPLKCIICPWK